MNNIHKCCPMCGSATQKPLPEYESHYLMKCSDCKMVFSAVIPTHQDLVAHYDNYGRNDYLSPITIKRYHELLDQLEPYRQFNRILDVGCGIGYFLEVAKDRGWEVYGTEYTDEAIRICCEKGITIVKGDLTESMFSKGFFDVITAFEVIEHLAFPMHLLNTVNKLLRTAVVFYLTTPNFNSLIRRHLGCRWNVIAFPEHLSYFTRKPLENGLMQSGFKKKQIYTHGISVSRFKTSIGNSNQKFISATSDDEQIRISFERNRFKKALKRVINFGLSIFGVGDTLKALTEKR